MKSIHLPRGRAERTAALAAIIVVALGTGGLLALAANLIDGQTPGAPGAAGASPAIAVASLAITTATPGTTAAQASGAPPSLAPHRSSAPAEASLAETWSLPSGWRYDLQCDDLPECLLHLYDAAGTEQDGWPVAIPGDCNYDMATGPRDEVFVACSRDGRVIVTGLDRTGAALAGWPIRLRGDVAWSTWNDFAGWTGTSSVGVGPDETVYVAVAARGDPGRYAIHALAPDGSPRAGWPHVLPGDAQGFLVAPNGTVVAWWYEGVEEGIDLEARRTVYASINPDGRTTAGWPIGSRGAASAPVVWGDGSIYYVSATGKVWGHDRTGSVVKGWPYQLSYPVAPALRPDGMLLFVGESEVVVLDRRGDVIPGWPYRTNGTFDAPVCDTPGWPYQPSATTEEGRLYLAEWDGKRATIIALGVDGWVPAGWPYTVRDGWRVTSLDLAGGGGVTVSLSADACGGGLNDTTFQIRADGRIVGDGPPPLPTRLEEVYEALRLDPLRTPAGSTTFRQGDQIDLETALVNRSRAPVILPYIDYGDESYYAAGTLQTWIERLGPDTEMGCLPNAGRKDAWYATGGWIQVSSAPMTIPPGGRMGPLLQPSLWPDLTGCLPPGDYRYHVEYKSLDGEMEDVNDEASIDFTITAVGVSPPAPLTSQPPPSPTPSPRRTPSPTPSPTPWVNRSPSPSPTDVPPGAP